MFVCYVIMLIISCTALHLCIETHESQTCLTLAKKLFYYVGKLFNVFRGPIWCEMFSFLAKRTEDFVL